MEMPDFEWLPYALSAPIKEESGYDLSLSSPPTSPCLLPSPTPVVSSPRRRSSSPLPLNTKRYRPYPTRRTLLDSKMATGYPSTWERGSSRQPERRPSDQYGATRYTAEHAPFAGSSDRSPTSNMPMTHAHDIRYNDMSSPRQEIDMSLWTSGSMTMMPNQFDPSFNYPGVPGPYMGQPLSYPASRESQSPTFPTQISSPFPSSTSSTSHAQEEIQRLRKRIQILEQSGEEGKQRVQALEAQLSRETSPAGSSISTPPQSAAFQASWKARTDARVRQFCSLNRAGNALCSWHDSRRERRMYPPRMAPPGYLNCGCTYEEALFEESLARHGVGSYLPGEMVRMDPALRNPLLKVLQHRYGYRDGDFERDARTGDWLYGEGPAYWEQQIAAGITNPRRPRSEHERR